MTRKVILADFAQERDLLMAIEAVQRKRWEIIDVYAPYAIHGLDKVLGWRRSLLPVACLVGGAAGVALSFWFQVWTTAQDWPLNVGGRPWNSLPAFVPVTFECMVLFAGITLVIAWLVRCGLYPGKKCLPPLDRVTDDRFALVVVDPGAAETTAVQKILLDCHALDVRERGGDNHQ